jgi:ATP-dependent DNA ligase
VSKSAKVVLVARSVRRGVDYRRARGLASLRKRPGPRPAGFIEPCLPSARSLPPPGGNWLHEIKHDGYRMQARRDGARI